MLDLTQWVQLASVAGALIATATLVKGLFEYQKQTALKRAEHFFKLRERLKENESFKEICNLLDHDDPKIAEIPFKDKRDFLGLFEEVALALNSGLIRAPVAQYMFGYYAIRCWDNDKFWEDVNRNSIYWSLFRHFVEKMKSIEDGKPSMPNNQDCYRQNS
jgi:hypothetical protein